MIIGSSQKTLLYLTKPWVSHRWYSYQELLSGHSLPTKQLSSVAQPSGDYPSS
jgi:hypothetical protein